MKSDKKNKVIYISIGLILNVLNFVLFTLVINYYF